MIRELSLFLHLLGVILWVGGTAAGAWTAAQLALAPKESRAAGLGAVRRALLVLTMPGIVLAWLGGLTMFLTALDLYSHAGWMHGKLTLGLVLSALHGVLIARVRKAADGTREGSSGLFGGLAMGIVLVTVLVLGLVIFRPGG